MIRTLVLQSGRLVALPLAALLLSASLAQADFRGGGVLFGFTETCAQHGWDVNSVMPVRTRYTASEDVSAPPSQITIAMPTGTEHVSYWGDMAPTPNFLGAAGRQLWGRFAQYGLRPMMRVVQRTVLSRINPAQPATIPNAREILLRVRVQNFNNLPGCAATVTAVMRRI